jgi:hypothetical protein
MISLVQAQQYVINFISQELKKDKDSIRILKLVKIDQNWKCSADITEENKYLKKLNYPPVFEHNIYIIELDEEGIVIGYYLKEEEES